MSIFPRDWLDLGLPDDWHAAHFPTIMSGEVIRFYWGADRDDADEVVTASRDGVGLCQVMFNSADDLDDLRQILTIAKRHADRLGHRDPGRWCS